MTFLAELDSPDSKAALVVRAVMPLYDTIVIAAKIAITTTTISNSTIVNPLFLFMFDFMSPLINTE